MSYEPSALTVSMDHTILDRFPRAAVCTATLRLAYETLPTPLLNHSCRVYLLAKWLAEKEAVICNDVLLFIACICHDLGASDLYNGEQRFEIEGADAACEVLRREQFDDADCHKVWTAIALHTSAGIAERIDPFTRLVRVAVKMDFNLVVREQYEAVAYANDIEALLPRMEVEKVLADSVVKQARKIPQKVNSTTWPDSAKHPKASWPGILLRAHIENPRWDGINHAF